MRMYKGEITDVMGTTMRVRRILRGDDGMDYELYESIRDDARHSGAVRVLDANADKVVVVNAFPTYEKAVAKFDAAAEHVVEVEEEPTLNAVEALQTYSHTSGRTRECTLYTISDPQAGALNGRVVRVELIHGRDEVTWVE